MSEAVRTRLSLVLQVRSKLPRPISVSHVGNTGIFGTRFAKCGIESRREAATFNAPYIGSHRPDAPVLRASFTGPLASVMRVLLFLLLARSVFAGQWCEYFTPCQDRGSWVY